MVTERGKSDSFLNPQLWVKVRTRIGEVKNKTKRDTDNSPLYVYYTLLAWDWVKYAVCVNNYLREAAPPKQWCENRYSMGPLKKKHDTYHSNPFRSFVCQPSLKWLNLYQCTLLRYVSSSPHKIVRDETFKHNRPLAMNTAKLRYSVSGFYRFKYQKLNCIRVQNLKEDKSIWTHCGDRLKLRSDITAYSRVSYKTSSCICPTCVWGRASCSHSLWQTRPRCQLWPWLEKYQSQSQLWKRESGDIIFRCQG